MASKYLGRAFIRVNGVTVPSMPGTAKFMPGGEERTPVLGDFGYLGYTSKPMQGEIECEIAVGPDTDLDTINKTTDATITFEGDTGQVWIMRNAVLATPAAVQSGEGKASLKFFGSEIEKV